MTSTGRSVDLPLLAVSTEIGRGHPSYLDSVLLALARTPAAGPGSVPVLPVDEVSTGVSRSAWRAVRSLYDGGSSGGIRTAVYNRLRSRGSPSSLQLGLLGSSLRRRLDGYQGTCLVEHPLVARILSTVCRVAYVHGEIAAPASAAVAGAWRTFVPLESTAARLAESGSPAAALAVTGLIIEPELLDAAETAFCSRTERLKSDSPLTIGFFTSGAYPRPHIDRIVTSVRSVLDAGHRAVVFAGTARRRAVELRTRLRKSGARLHDTPRPEPGQALFVAAISRAAETSRTARLFHHLDVMVAAAHERTNWAVGLGLPLFTLLPHVGPFAPLNHEFAQAQDVCESVASDADAALLGRTLTRLRGSGRLAAMSDNGWNRLPTDGAARAARLLVEASREER